MSDMPCPADSSSSTPTDRVANTDLGGEVASIASLKCGETGVLCDSRIPESDNALLRAMGLHPEARIRLCRQGEPCIVAVSTSTSSSGNDCGCGSECRIGLAKSLAQQIFVKIGTRKQ